VAPPPANHCSTTLVSSPPLLHRSVTASSTPASRESGRPPSAAYSIATTSSTCRSHSPPSPASRSGLPPSPLPLRRAPRLALSVTAPPALVAFSTLVGWRLEPAALDPTACDPCPPSAGPTSTADEPRRGSLGPLWRTEAVAVASPNIG
jgi:hypothetical protein